MRGFSHQRDKDIGDTFDQPQMMTTVLLGLLGPKTLKSDFVQLNSAGGK